MKIRRYKEKIICGAKTTMHITESDGREFDATLICEKSPKHFGKHREIKEWDSTNSVMVTFSNLTKILDEARADERQKIQRLKKALSEYLNLLEEDRRLFSLTLSGDDEPQPTKYMGDWIANTIKLKKSEKKLIKIFREYKAKGEKK